MNIKELTPIGAIIIAIAYVIFFRLANKFILPEVKIPILLDRFITFVPITIFLVYWAIQYFKK
ncbi:hypothetical protein [Anaerobranca gottschalkii]|uniref:Uncharacterized protein n=1 Tax=Anaerobranca gottschalkii DSM 13577 TaxID=1120990 RepID=A0A1I0B9P1_9FIRM|nr:hypothetical protein [Anaerobranca gottschalkii]SET03246.1 hypothetical protein SAMN03080614_103416 [Anaerobranca gottschalkii DSM 13577]